MHKFGSKLANRKNPRRSGYGFHRAGQPREDAKAENQQGNENRIEFGTVEKWPGSGPSQELLARRQLRTPARQLVKPDIAASNHFDGRVALMTLLSSTYWSLAI
jgi:hypothetical protein